MPFSNFTTQNFHPDQIHITVLCACKNYSRKLQPQQHIAMVTHTKSDDITGIVAITGTDHVISICAWSWVSADTWCWLVRCHRRCTWWWQSRNDDHFSTCHLVNISHSWVNISTQWHIFTMPTVHITQHLQLTSTSQKILIIEQTWLTSGSVNSFTHRYFNSIRKSEFSLWIRTSHSTSVSYTHLTLPTNREV